MLFAPASAAAVTLKEATALALHDNRQIEAQQMNSEAAHAQASEASAHLWPQVDASLTGSRTNNPLNAFGTRLLQRSVTAADFNPQQLNHPGAVNNYQTEVAVRLPIYQGGAVWASRKQTGAIAEAADWQLETTRQQTILQLIDTFTAALEAKSLVDASQKALDSANSHLRNVQAQLKRGFAIQSDVMDAEAHQLQAEVNLRQTQNALATALDQLQLITGSSKTLDPDDRISLKLPTHDMQQWIEQRWRSTRC